MSAARFQPVDPLRLRHGHGERLSGRDFATQAAQDDQLRWWHNRAVHRAYGIARGLAVTAAEDGPRVQPGIAYDRHGRELEIVEARPIAVPAGPGPSYLVLSRGCTGGVTLRWHAAGEPWGAGVAVHAAGDGKFVAPRAVALARARIGRGASVAGSGWRPWIEGEPPGTGLGLQLEVDASAAGFTATPRYFIQVTGSLWDTWPDPASEWQRPMALFAHLHAPTKDAFTVRLVVPWLFLASPKPGLVLRARRDTPPDPEVARAAAARTDLAVTWIGVQHNGEDGT